MADSKFKIQDKRCWSLQVRRRITFGFALAEPRGIDGRFKIQDSR